MNNSTSNKLEYMILGGGLAGCLFAWQLLKHKKSFMIWDEGLPNTSSRIAAGMYNPVSGKRLTIKPNMNGLLDEMHTTFRELEVLLDIQLLYPCAIQQAFGNIKEGNEFYEHLDNDRFGEYVNTTTSCNPHLLAPYGCYEIRKGGWVDTGLFIEKFTAYLDDKKCLYRHPLNRRLMYDESKVFNAKFVFCQGYYAIHNRYFRWLPFKLCKGQVLIIKCPGLSQEKILKRGVYLVPLGNELFKVGATYEWDDLDESPTGEGRDELLKKLGQMISLPYELVDHKAGIRPTTRDRQPMLGVHPEHSDIFIFNGLGTKGVLQGPSLARKMYELTENGIAPGKEINISRFESFYSFRQTDI